MKPITKITKPVVRKHAPRFFSKISKSEDCWIWTGRVNENGYGVFDLNKRPMLAHRVAFALEKGQISEGMFICHKCDNPICVNPDHLFEGTHQDNMADMVSKDRQVKGESHSGVMRKFAARGSAHMSKTHPEIVRRGAHAAGAKLVEQDIWLIRSLWANGGISQKELAANFRVSASHISGIVNRVFWRHI